MGKKPLILFQDEAGFDKIGDVRKSWSPKGIRSVCQSQFVREYLYLYSAVSPIEGEIFSLLTLPEASTEAMNIYCLELSKSYPGRNILMFMDRAGWHVSKKLKLPENFTIDFLPPYSPELNPQENVWKYLRTNHFANVYANSLDAVPKLTLDKKLVRSISGYTWIVSVF